MAGNNKKDLSKVTSKSKRNLQIADNSQEKSPNGRQQQEKSPNGRDLQMAGNSKRNLQMAGNSKQRAKCPRQPATEREVLSSEARNSDRLSKSAFGGSGLRLRALAVTYSHAAVCFTCEAGEANVTGARERAHSEWPRSGRVADSGHC